MSPETSSADENRLYPCLHAIRVSRRFDAFHILLVFLRPGCFELIKTSFAHRVVSFMPKRHRFSRASEWSTEKTCALSIEFPSKPIISRDKIANEVNRDWSKFKGSETISSLFSSRWSEWGTIDKTLDRIVQDRVYEVDWSIEREII